MNKILFVWDFHGVLEKDNEYAVQELCNLVFDELGQTRKLSIEEVRDWYGLSWFDYFKLSFPDGNEDLWNSMVTKVHSLQQRGWDIIQKHIKPRDFAKEVLMKVQTSEHENILLSNVRPEYAKLFTDLIGITQYFSQLIGVDTDNNSQIEEGLVNAKSQALSKYLDNKTFKKIIVIGDSDIDIRAGIDNNATTYLFQSPDFAKKQNSVKPNHIINDLRNILQELNM